MKQLFLAILGWLAFSIIPIIGMEQATKKQATVAEAPELLALAPELADEEFRNAVAWGSASKVLELLKAPRSSLHISLDELYPQQRMSPIFYDFPVGAGLPPLLVSALHVAATKGHTQVAHVLLEHGASVDILDSIGMTPLMWAAQEGHLAMVKVLIDAGANDDIQTPNGGAHAFLIAYMAENEADDVEKGAIQEVVGYFVERGFSNPYLLNRRYILEKRKLVAHVLARGGLITWPQQGDDPNYAYWVDERDVSPLEYAKARNLPSYKLLREADACDNITLGAKAARRTIFAALCTFQRLNNELLKNYKLSKDVQRRILRGSCLAEDLLKGAAYVRKEHRRNYEYLMETIQKRCGKLFSIAEILAFFVRNSH